MSLLYIYYRNNLIGRLIREEGTPIEFHYEASWIKEGFPISQSLPLENEDLGINAFRFFTNLLPEGDARKRIVNKLKIPDEDFALLEAIGGECAGALIVASDLVDTDQAGYERLTEEAFDRIVETSGLSVTSRNSGSRLSLAGAQDKLPIYLDEEGGYQLPCDGAASTHIIKFNVRQYKNVPAYETLMASIAEKAGINVAPIKFCRHPKGDYALIKRYDRYLDADGWVQRLHQEDFCQATGRSSGSKYIEREEGSPLGEIFDMIRTGSEEPVQDMREIVRWQIFNVLAGNSDAHLKNISLLYKEGRASFTLAPFYDLVCTRTFEDMDRSLAIPVGSQFDPDLVTEADWMQMASECGIGSRLVLNEVRRIGSNLPAWTVEAITEFEAKYGEYPALERISLFIEKSCRRQQK